MYHEILFALWGFPGDILRITSDGFEVAKGFGNLHPSETELLERICEIAFYYKHVADFANGQGNDCHGMYGTVLRTAVSDELAGYRTTLVELERCVAREPDTPLSYVSYMLQKHRTTLLELYRLQKHIVEEHITGLSLLSTLSSAISHAIPVVRPSLERILHRCHLLLMRQLALWMVYGILTNEDEFFIKGVERENSAAPTPLAVIPECEGKGCVTGSEPVVDWDTFRVDSTLLPSLIGPAVADDILFTGKTAHILHTSPNGNAQARRPEEPNDGDEILKHFSELEQQDHIDSRQVERLVKAVKLKMTRYLWSVLVEEASLLDCIDMARSTFLLGNQLFFQTLLDSLLSLPGALTGSWSRAELQQALHSTVIDTNSDERLSRVFSLQPVEAGAEGGILGKVTLTFKAEWPLTLIFTPDVLTRYSQLFAFLFALLQARTMIANLWTCFKILRPNPLEMDPNGYGHRLAMARAAMEHVFSCCYVYMQDDVIRQHYEPMRSQIRSTENLDTLKRVHWDYLTALHGQAFLHNPYVTSRLRAMGNCVAEFCATVHAIHWPISATTYDKASAITEEFVKQAQLLCRVLSKMRANPKSSRSVGRLLHALTFNDYLS